MENTGNTRAKSDRIQQLTGVFMMAGQSGMLSVYKVRQPKAKIYSTVNL